MGIGVFANYLANFLSFLSLFCGFISIIFSLKSHFTFAAWAIILSVIFDGLDGQIARLNPSPSEFGKEVDSLIDVISFGIAPSILGYTFVYRDFYVWATLALFIYLLCSVWRLALYNITPKQELRNYFYGLPTTISGGVLASFILIYRNQEGMFLPRFLPKFLFPKFIPVLFLVLVLCLAFLMVSRVKYFNLDAVKHFAGRKLGVWVFLLASGMIASGIFKKEGIFLFSLFSLYLVFSPFVVKKLHKESH